MLSYAYIFIAEYEIISNEFRCEHTSGGFPFDCKQQLESPETCEKSCNEFAACVGYFDDTDSGYCYLFPSTHYCPSNDWEQFNGYVAVARSQLSVTSNAGNCKAKVQKIVAGTT